MLCVAVFAMFLWQAPTVLGHTAELLYLLLPLGVFFLVLPVLATLSAMALKLPGPQRVTLTMVPHGDSAPAASAAPRISGGAVDLTEPESDEALTIDIHELEDATDVAETGIDRLTRAFPGAVVIEEDEVAG